jgi:hypothetical protein
VGENIQSLSQFKKKNSLRRRKVKCKFMEKTHEIIKKMSGIRDRFFIVNASVSFDIWEKIAKVYPHSKRAIHYEKEKLINYGKNI